MTACKGLGSLRGSLRTRTETKLALSRYISVLHGAGASPELRRFGYRIGDDHLYRLRLLKTVAIKTVTNYQFDI